MKLHVLAIERVRTEGRQGRIVPDKKMPNRNKLRIFESLIERPRL
jgi:hypothetical protein